NSVSPSTTPKNKAFNKNSVDSVILLFVQIAAFDTHCGNTAVGNIQYGKYQHHVAVGQLAAVALLWQMVKAVKQVAGQRTVVFFFVDQAVYVKQQLQMVQVGRAVHTPAVFGFLDDVERFVLVGKLARNGFKHIDGGDQAFNGAEFVSYQHKLAARAF